MNNLSISTKLICIVCNMMQSIGALALGYGPTAAEVAAITALFEKVSIVAESS